MRTRLSIRLPSGLLERLRRRAEATPGATASGLAQRLVEEGLRTGDHPGVVFKDGPSGRRAALAFGPDVWEVVKALGEVDERGDAAVPAAAALLALPEAKVRVAMHYYAAYPGEVAREITEADDASAAAEAAWHTEQRLLT